MVSDNSIFYWQKILLAWQELGRKGLTLPFLLGANTVFDESLTPTLQDAKKLLAEMFEHGISGKTISISWYAVNKTYAIVITNDTVEEGNGALPVYTVDMIASEEFGSSPEEIIDGLANLYAEQIRKRTYSITHGVWHPYTENDRTFIASALM
jgi:hypothetical protein